MALTERQRGEMFASHATSSLALARGALLAAPPSHCADGRGALPPSCLLGAGMRPSRRTWNRLEVILPKLPPTLPPRQAWIAPQWPPPRVRPPRPSTSHPRRHRPLGRSTVTSLDRAQASRAEVDFGRAAAAQGARRPTSNAAQAGVPTVCSPRLQTMQLEKENEQLKQRMERGEGAASQMRERMADARDDFRPDGVATHVLTGHRDVINVRALPAPHRMRARLTTVWRWRSLGRPWPCTPASRRRRRPATTRLSARGTLRLARPSGHCVATPGPCTACASALAATCSVRPCRLRPLPRPSLLRPCIEPGRAQPHVALTRP